MLTSDWPAGMDVEAGDRFAAGLIDQVNRIARPEIKWSDRHIKPNMGSFLPAVYMVAMQVYPCLELYGGRLCQVLEFKAGDEGMEKEQENPERRQGIQESPDARGGGGAVSENWPSIASSVTQMPRNSSVSSNQKKYKHLSRRKNPKLPQAGGGSSNPIAPAALIASPVGRHKCHIRVRCGARAATIAVAAATNTPPTA